MTREEIVTGILTGNFESEDLKAINQALRNAYDMANMRTKAAFAVGDKVDLQSKRLGKVRCTVTKLLPKNIQVKVDGSFQVYRCSPGLLTKAG